MPKAAIFGLDGTLLDSVDLHALAWHEAMTEFGYDVSFEQARSQIGKGGDKLIPVFLSEDAQRTHGEEFEAWRSEHFKARYLPLIRPFSAVPDLLKRAPDAGRIAIASSAKKDELKQYLDIAGVAKLVDATTSSDDIEESKPAPDIFEVVLKKLQSRPATRSPSATRRTTRRPPAKRASRRSACSAAGSPKVRCGQPVASMFIPGRPRFSCASTTRGLRSSRQPPARSSSGGHGPRG